MMMFKTLISAAQLMSGLNRPGLCVVDCRFDLGDPDAGRQEFLHAHIPGARYADLNRDLAAPVGPLTGRHPLPDPDAFAHRLGELGIGNDSQVVAYDAQNGSFAARLWWMLRWLGHNAVAVLDGGFHAWLAAGGAVESGASSGGAARFTPRHIDAAAVVGAAQLERSLAERAALLVDARAAERFTGRVEPIDPVAGHVRGAVNHPFSSNLQADGRFLPAALLKERWRERLAGADPTTLVAMCGSGVTACHNLLALEIAGLGGGKLYAGSWSEWIRDPKRAVARD
jgi:thiosulfate/3-mercaptopyruvate sulfurtransferase